MLLAAAVDAFPGPGCVASSASPSAGSPSGSTASLAALAAALAGEHLPHDRCDHVLESTAALLARALRPRGEGLGVVAGALLEVVHGVDVAFELAAVVQDGVRLHADVVPEGLVRLLLDRPPEEVLADLRWQRVEEVGFQVLVARALPSTCLVLSKSVVEVGDAQLDVFEATDGRWTSDHLPEGRVAIISSSMNALDD